MKFKTRPGRSPQLKFKDRCGDKLHAFLPTEDMWNDDDDYAFVVWTEGGRRVGMTRKQAAKFAKLILAEMVG